MRSMSKASTKSIYPLFLLALIIVVRFCWWRGMSTVPETWIVEGKLYPAMWTENGGTDGSDESTDEWVHFRRLADFGQYVLRSKRCQNSAGWESLSVIDLTRVGKMM